MKNLAKIIFVVLIITVSCEKQDTILNLVGKWEIYGTGGGIGGSGARYNFNNLILNRKDNYQITRNDTIIESGAYKISKHNIERFNGLGEFKIDFTPEQKIGSGARWIIPIAPIIIQMISNDTIGLCEAYADGFAYYFHRLNE